MLFNSLSFLVFFASVFVVHWSLPRRARTLFLLGASYGFYASWNWKFLALIFASTMLDYVLARVIDGTSDPGKRKAALLTSVIGNIGVLSFFKYYNFFIDSLNELLQPLGASAEVLHLDLILPLGISFYTLQTLSYTIDVYRGRMSAVRDFPDFALYVCFFPQLVAGPIERASHLVPQIQADRRIDLRDVQEGLTLMLWGLFKKVVIADNMARMVDPVYVIGAKSAGGDVLIATVGFAIQVYADFSAYSDIARGAGRLLGFNLVQNFDTPFFGRDMADFWRRWHMSLSAWLRDYLYIALGGNRGSEARVSFNLFITFFVAGIWHGADGTFFLFGTYHGVLVVLTRWYRQVRPVREGAWLWPGALLRFGLFSLSMVIFRGETVAQSLDLYSAMLFDMRFSPSSGMNALMLFAATTTLFLFDVGHARARTDLFLLRWRVPAQVAVFTLLLNIMILLGRSDEIEFVYFQF